MTAWEDSRLLPVTEAWTSGRRSQEKTWEAGRYGLGQSELDVPLWQAGSVVLKGAWDRARQGWGWELS